ncbi:unnamed protein product, partial [Prorocentrum cordatum]
MAMHGTSCWRFFENGTVRRQSSVSGIQLLTGLTCCPTRPTRRNSIASSTKSSTCSTWESAAPRRSAPGSPPTGPFRSGASPRRSASTWQSCSLALTTLRPLTGTPRRTRRTFTGCSSSWPRGTRRPGSSCPCRRGSSATTLRSRRTWSPTPPGRHPGPAARPGPRPGLRRHAGRIREREAAVPGPAAARRGPPQRGRLPADGRGCGRGGAPRAGLSRALRAPRAVHGPSRAPFAPLRGPLVTRGRRAQRRKAQSLGRARVSAGARRPLRGRPAEVRGAR